MKSKASIDGHPVHPIFVSFPIAFFTGTLVLDILALVRHSSNLATFGKYMNMAGIAMALIAATPGIIDYFYTVPPNSSAKKRATQHGIINVTITVLFVVTLVMKNNFANPAVVIGIEAAAMILLGISGYMGGTLVYRNQIGVYNRYADKGVWREETSKKKEGKIEVANAAELKLDQMKLVHVKDKRIVIGRNENGYVAFDDHCSHKGGSLAGGIMICNIVQCPWHGSQFDLATGKAVMGPATDSIKTYEVYEEAGKVYLMLP